MVHFQSTGAAGLTPMITAGPLAIGLLAASGRGPARPVRAGWPKKFVAVEVSLGIGAISQALIGRMKPVLGHLRFNADAVEHPLAPRRRNEVASMEFRSSVSLKACCLAQNQ